jgi:hypothetical protein
MKPHARSALAALVLAAVALAASPQPAAAARPRALSLDGTLGFTFVSSTLVPPVLLETYDFEGDLGDLGEVTGVAHEAIEVATAGTEYLAVASSFTIVTANGDKVFGHSVGYIDQVDGTISEVLTITGGTGGYRGATGTATGRGSLATSSETFSGTVYVPR